MAFGYDGSIRIKADLNHSPFDQGLSAMTGKVQSFSNTLKKLAGIIGLAFGTAAIINFGKESVRAASELSDAWIGLQSIVEGQGRSFSRAKSFVEEYVSDGLVPLTDAVTAYKSLAARGYNDEQIQKTMVALKDAAAFGRQSTYTMGEAIATAAEGLKNENSILVDNAGVTKNVAKMWEDYAKSIGTTANKLTTEQKIQAEVNGILEETRFQTGDAAKLVNTYSGQVAMLGYNFQQLKVQVGNAIMPIVQAVLPGINAIISALIKLAKVFAQVTSLLFGKSTEVTATNGIASSASSAADATDNLAAATEGAGNASESAAKKMKGVLAGFDELNILADSASSSLSGAADGLDLGDTAVEIPEVEIEGDLFEDVQISPKLLAEVEAFKDAIGRIWEVFKQSWEENGPAVIEAGKRALTSLYELAKSIGKAFTEAWTGGAGLEFLDAVFALLETVLNIIADIADAWKTAFDNVGSEFFESILFKFTEILKLINSIGEAFREAWNDGSGVEICETILRIFTNINNTIGTIALKIREAWEANGNGVAIWNAILDIVQTVLGFIERLTEATLNWAQGLNLEPLMSAFRGLLEAINPLVEVITNGLAYAYENVLLPFGKWFLEELAPVGLELVTAAIELLTSVLEALEPLAEWLWENFLQPLAEWTGDVIISALNFLADALKAISDWISNNQTLVQGMIVTLGLFFAAWEVKKLVDFVSDVGNVIQVFGNLHGTISQIITTILGLNTTIVGIGSVIAGVVTAVTSFFSMWNNGFSLAKEAVMLVGIALTAVGAILLGVPAVVAAIVAGIVAAVATAAVLIHEHWDEIKEFAIGAFESIKEAWSNAGEWFGANVIQPVAEFFAGLWENISALASDTWQAVQNAWVAASAWFGENVVEPVKEFFADLWESIATLASETWSKVQEVWNVVSAWFNDNVIGPVKTFFDEMWENICQLSSEAWEAIKNAWSAAGEWFRSTITEPIMKFFSEAWDKIKTSASEAWENIKNGVQNFWNELKSWWSSNVGKYFTAEYWKDLGKRMVDGLLDGLKNIFSGLTSWASDVWSSVTGAFSAQKAKSSISSGINYAPRMASAEYAAYSARDLPRLANGAVIPPNQQFAAVLGDQRSGKNLEAPASLIKQMVMEGIQAAGGIGSGGNMTVIMEIDGREFGRASYKYGTAERQRVGVSFTEVRT